MIEQWPGTCTSGQVRNTLNIKGIVCYLYQERVTITLTIPQPPDNRSSRLLPTIPPSDLTRQSLLQTSPDNSSPRLHPTIPPADLTWNSLLHPTIHPSPVNTIVYRQYNDNYMFVYNVDVFCISLYVSAVHSHDTPFLPNFRPVGQYYALGWVGSILDDGTLSVVLQLRHTQGQRSTGALTPTHTSQRPTGTLTAPHTRTSVHTDPNPTTHKASGPRGP